MPSRSGLSVGSPMPRCASTLAERRRGEAGRSDGDGDDDGCREQQRRAPTRPRAGAQRSAPTPAGRRDAQRPYRDPAPAARVGRLETRRWRRYVDRRERRLISTRAPRAGRRATRRRRRCARPPRSPGSRRRGTAAAAPRAARRSPGSTRACAIFCSAVFQAASTSTMTSGSASTIASQPIEVHVSSTSAATFSRPAASMIICGAPMPAPTYGVSSPEEYQSAVSPRRSARSRRARRAARHEVGRGIRNAEEAAGLLDLAEHLVERQRVRHVALALARGRGDVGGDAELRERRPGRPRPRRERFDSQPAKTRSGSAASVASCDGHLVGEHLDAGCRVGELVGHGPVDERGADDAVLEAEREQQLEGRGLDGDDALGRGVEGRPRCRSCRS